MLVSLIIIALWAIAFFLGDRVVSPGFNVHPAAAGVAAATAIASFIAYFWGGVKHIQQLALSAYLLMTITTMLVIVTTGQIGSPFIALWMLVCVFGGIFGKYGLIPLALSATTYGIYIVTGLSGSRDELVIFVLAFLLPIFISYMIWHQKSDHEDKSDKAYTDLAKELSQVANKSEIVINAITDGVIAIDGKGMIQLINPAGQSIIGWAKQDALELDYRSVIKLTDNKDGALAAEMDPIQQVLNASKTIVNNEFTLTSNAGKKMTISLLVSPVGQLGAGAIIVFRDITSDVAEERQQAEFISTASHEMRTPVAAIEGYLGLALNPQTAAIDEKARLYLTKAHESAQHLGRLFQDLLDVSRAEDGRLKNNPSVVDVVTYARDITNSLLPSAQAKGLILLYKPDISAQAPARITPVYYSSLDNDHFREVLSNIIENAIKYTSAGDVTVDVGGDDEHVLISVKDTGIGIPHEDISHLFQKFYRVDNSATREIGGTGLGLYLSRRLVETMNGRIWVESEFNKGSVFYMEFPRISSEEASVQIEESTNRENPNYPQIVQS
ncbi:MAG TPA: ATP-binding protein [Candidatus Nitrosotenuis sp.]|nr:ATP-binding protein [Candidatus Nitrosotenuis sp.]